MANSRSIAIALIFAVGFVFGTSHAIQCAFEPHSAVTLPDIKATLAIPRGGGESPIKPELLLKIYAAFYGLNGALGLPAPESSGTTFPDLTVVKSPAHVAYENLGAASLSYALLVYLTAIKKVTAIPRAIAWSSLPMAYVHYKNMLNGAMTNLGAAPWQGPAMILVLGICIFRILRGQGNVKLTARILASVPLVQGLLSELSPSLGSRLVGFKDLPGSSKTFYIWFAALAAGYGILAQLLLGGAMDPMQAVGLAALVESIFMVDCMYFRKWNVDVAPPASNYVFLGIPALTAASILISQSGVSTTVATGTA